MERSYTLSGTESCVSALLGERITPTLGSINGLGFPEETHLLFPLRLQTKQFVASSEV